MKKSMLWGFAMFFSLAIFACKQNESDQEVSSVIPPTTETETPATVSPTTFTTEEVTSTPSAQEAVQTPSKVRVSTPKKATPTASPVAVEEEKTAQEVLPPTKTEDSPVVKTAPTSTKNEAVVQNSPEPIEEAPVEVIPSHESWDGLLQKYVSSTGNVDYSGFKKERVKLEEYLTVLENNPPKASWSKNEQLAFWINAYNAATVKLILDNYPISSIMKIDNGKAWDRRWIKIGGKTYTLNEIENSIIRPTFKDARIHFAVNCAAVSCPKLHNRAFTANNLNATLNRQTKAFINNAAFNTINTGSIEVSKIFDWYGSDFGNLIDYLNQYAEVKIKSNAKISFKEYNWNLNGK